MFIVFGMNDDPDTAPPFSLLALDHVVLRVHDVDRSIAFYCGVLGGHVERTLPDLGLHQLRAGNSLIDLVDVNGSLGQKGGGAPGLEGRNMDHLCLEISPFNANKISAYLSGHGIDAGDVGNRYGAKGMGPSIYIEDPDGNTIELKGPGDAAST